MRKGGASSKEVGTGGLAEEPGPLVHSALARLMSRTDRL
jgi:hypothetical protein